MGGVGGHSNGGGGGGSGGAARGKVVAVHGTLAANGGGAPFDGGSSGQSGQPADAPALGSEPTAADLSGATLSPAVGTPCVTEGALC